MNKREAKIISLEVAVSLLRADLHQGGVSQWPGIEERDLAKVEDAVEELAQSLAVRARKLRGRS